MNSAILQALLIYGIAAVISFLVAALIKLMEFIVRVSRKEAQ